MAVQFAFAKIITEGLSLAVEAADPNSYPGSGNTWRDLITGTVTGSLVSCSFSSDFKGGITLSNVSSSILFTSSIGNVVSSSLTVDMTFRPARIEGIHWLFSKNSGSFPNYGAFISGSNGSGKVYLVCNMSSTVSCSFSSSDALVTGSTYVSNFRFSPYIVGTYSTPVAGASMTFNNGATKGGVLQANNFGTLGSSASFYIGNTSTQNLAFSGSIYNFKLYQGTGNFSQPGISYSLQNTRFGLPAQSPATRYIRTLVVGGGGNGGNNPYIGGIIGGGGGGGVVEAYTTINTGRNPVNVGTSVNYGDGVTGRGTSSFSDILAYGGGSGGGVREGSAGTGASGGGSNPAAAPTALNGVFQGFAGAITAGGGAGGPANGNFGGIGKASDITGTTQYYGGGGAGATLSIIPPSLGGGGGSTGYLLNIGISDAFNADTGAGYADTGSINTGGGGGGSFFDGRSRRTNVGGSGIVIMRYQGGQQAIGGRISFAGNDTIHTFTASGDFILL
jgi:hypothetical protein